MNTRVKARHFSLGAALLAIWPALAAGKDSFRIEYFTIRGATARELRTDLSRLGPVGETGLRGDAYTEYRIAWQFTMTPKDGSCRAHDMNVDLDVKMLLPRWDKPAKVAPELVRTWERFSAVLREHEDGHHRIAVAAAKEVRRRLGQRMRADRCETLEARLTDIANGVLAEYRRRQAGYDDQTDFGRKQTTGLL